MFFLTTRQKLGFFLCLISLIVQAASIERNKAKMGYKLTSDELLELNSKVLPKAVHDFPYLILYVYGNWCISASGMKRKFSELAEQHEIIDTRLTFGLLDIKDKREVETYDIHEVPSIIMFVKGTPHVFSWKDNPDYDKIAGDIEDLLKAEFAPLISLEEFQQFQTMESFALFYGSDEDEIHWDFYKTAENHFSHPLRFYHLEATASISQKIGLEANQIYFCRRESKCFPFSREELNVYTLYDWLNGQTEDPVLDIEKEGFNKVASEQAAASLVSSAQADLF